MAKKVCLARYIYKMEARRYNEINESRGVGVRLPWMTELVELNNRVRSHVDSVERAVR